MTVPPQVNRREQIDALSREIDRLIDRYPAMPPGRAQSILVQEIENLFKEIDRLNQEEHAEAWARYEKEAEPGYFAQPPGRYQGLGLGVLLICLGLIFSTSLLIVFGGVALLAVLSSSTRKPPPPPKEPAPAQQEWGWRP